MTTAQKEFNQRMLEQQIETRERSIAGFARHKDAADPDIAAYIATLRTEIEAISAMLQLVNQYQVPTT